MKIEFGKSFKVDNDKILLESKPLELLWIEPGEYLMGVPQNLRQCFYEEDIVLQFKTRISKGYWLSKYIVTQDHWKMFGNEPKSWFESSDTDFPAYGISWLEAMEFCKKLNDKFIEEIPNGYHFSLPTELHWEYAASAGQSPIMEGSINHKYNLIFDYASLEISPKKVGISEPNFFGIHDICGNVGQWCFDITNYYPEEPVADWIGNQQDIGFDVEYLTDGSIVGTGKYRTIRGAHVIPYREFQSYKIGVVVNPSSKKQYPLEIGFRICLRPMTQWDYNDPVIEKHNLNIIPR